MLITPSCFLVEWKWTYIFTYKCNAFMVFAPLWRVISYVRSQRSCKNNSNALAALLKKMISKGVKNQRLCRKDNLNKKGHRHWQTKTGTANAIFPTSSSACIIFLIRACHINELYQILRLDDNTPMTTIHTDASKCETPSRIIFLLLLFP